MDMPLKPRKSNICYRFGNDRQPSSGSTAIRIPLSSNKVLSERVDIVKTYFPFLIGLDMLGKYQMIIVNINNVLSYTNIHCKILPVRKQRHIFLEEIKKHVLYFAPKVSFSKFIKPFCISLLTKHFSLLIFVRPRKANDNTRMLVKKISKRCNFRQRLHNHQYCLKFPILQRRIGCLVMNCQWI